jgi:FkbM family methyltransferase
MWVFILKVLKKLQILNYLNLDIRHVANKKNLVIPVFGQIGKGNLINRELWMFSIVRKIYTYKQGVFIDVGVNIGQTLIHYKTAIEDGEYIGFEPNPLCVFYTSQLIQKNRWSNCTLIPTAIFHTNSLQPINYYANDTDSMASLVEDFRNDRTVTKKEYVPCYNREVINDLVKNRSIACIKIDVEGSESIVLNELKDIIIKHRPIIIIEILPYKTSSDIIWRNSILNMLEFILNEHYTIFRILKNNNSTFKEALIVQNIFDGLSRSTSDHIFCPSENNIILK